MAMRRLLQATAVAESLTGAAFLAAPTGVATILFDRALEGVLGLLVARVVGAALLPLGLACWAAGGDAHDRMAVPMVMIMLLYDGLAIVLLVYAGTALASAGVGLWPAVAGHAGLAAWCVVALQRRRRMLSASEAVPGATVS